MAPTALDGVPRAVRDPNPKRGEPEIARKHVIMIGVSRPSALYMKFLDAIAPGAHEIIAVFARERTRPVSFDSQRRLAAGSNTTNEMGTRGRRHWRAS